MQRLTLNDLRPQEIEVARIGANIPQELNVALEKFCDENSVSKSEVIRAGIQNFLVDAEAAKKAGKK